MRSRDFWCPTVEYYMGAIVATVGSVVIALLFSPYWSLVALLGGLTMIAHAYWRRSEKHK